MLHAGLMHVSSASNIHETSQHHAVRLPNTEKKRASMSSPPKSRTHWVGNVAGDPRAFVHTTNIAEEPFSQPQHSWEHNRSVALHVTLNKNQTWHETGQWKMRGHCTWEFGGGITPIPFGISMLKLLNALRRIIHIVHTDTAAGKRTTSR